MKTATGNATFKFSYEIAVTRTASATDRIEKGKYKRFTVKDLAREISQ